MKTQETAKYRLLAVDCCDELVDAIKSRALGGCISAVLRASASQDTPAIVAAQKPDAVVISGGASAAAAIDAAERSSSAILLLTDDTALPRRCIRAGVMTAHPDELAAVLPSLLATAERLRTLRDKTSSLQQRLDDSRIVARAKLLLISRLGMSEGDAHRYIEKTAMDSCLPRRDVAEGIIRTYEE